MKLSEEQINEHLLWVTGWQRDRIRIARDFQLANFQEALAFVNRVAVEAEALDHHPDILLHGWNKVWFSITTHQVGGLTEKDFQLAERINELSGEGLLCRERIKH